MGFKRFLFITAILNCFSTAYAADRHWVATGGSGAWNTTASWSLTTGGASGASIPGVGDQAIFDSGTITPCILSAAVTVSSITMSTSTTGGYTGYLDVSTRTLTIRQNFTLNKGTFYARTSSITVQGNWSVSPVGNFVANTSSITFSGTALGNTIDTGGDPFYKLIFNGAAGGWTTINNPVTVSSFTVMNGGSLTIANSSMTNAGDFQVTAGSTLTINNDLEVDDGNFVTATAGIVLANSTATLRLSGSGTLGGGTGGIILPNVITSGAGTTTLGSRISILGGLTNSHILDVSASNFGITVSSGWINTGTYTARSGSVTFIGGGTNLSVATNGSDFYNLRFNGTGSWSIGSGPITVSSDIYVLGGTFNIAGSSLTATGSLLVTTPGTVNIDNDLGVSGSSITNTGTITSLSTPTVTMSGAGSLGGTGSTVLPALSLTTAKPTTLAGPITIQGAFTNAAGHTLDPSAGNFGITISSNWANSGILNTTRTSSVTFTGSVPNGTIATNGYAFYNLSFNGGTWRNITNTVTVSSNMYVNGGTFTVGGSSLTTTGSIDVNSGGVFAIDNDVGVNGGTIANAGTITNLTTATVTMTGAGVLGGLGATDLPKLTLAGAGTTTLGGAIVLQGSATILSGRTLDTSLGNNYQITVSSWFANDGTFTARNGTVLVNSTATFTGTSSFYNFTAATPGITITFQKTSTTTVTNTLTFTGASGNPILLRSTTAGQSWSLAASGTSSVSWVDVEDSDARSGLTITPANGTNSGNNRNWDFGGPGINRTWWGTADTVWSNGSNWDTGVPIASKDSALIVSTATHMPTLTASVSISTLSIVAASTLTLNGFDLTLTSFSNAGILALQGNENITTAPTNISGSTVVYNATSGMQIIYSTWTYMNLQINGVGGTFTPTGDMTVSQAFTITGGTFLNGNDTLNFTGTSGTYGITTKNNPFYNVVFNSPTGTWVMQDSMTISSTINLEAGTLNSKSGTTNNGLAVGGEWLNSGGVFITNNSSITFTGSGNNLRIQSGDDQFWKILFTGSGSWNTDSYELTVSSMILVNAGNFQVSGGSSLTVAGNPAVGAAGTLDIEGDMWINTGGLLNLGTITGFSTATLTLNGAGVLGGAGNTVLPSLSLIGNTFTTTLSGPLTLLGSMTNATGHTLDPSAGNYGMTVEGNWANSGILNTTRTSSVTFSGATANGTIATNGYAFYNLSFNGGVWRNITNPVTVSSSMYINAGTFTVGGSSLTVAGSISTNSGGTFAIDNDVLINGGGLTNNGTISTLATATPTVTLNGAGTLGGAGSTTLPKLTLTGATQTTLGGDIVLAGSATISATHTLDVSASNYQITISSWFANNGTFAAHAGTVLVNSAATLTGSTTFYNFTATTPGITMTFQAGTTQYITNALSLSGASGNDVKLRSTAGVYMFHVSVSSFVSFVDVQDCIASSQTLYAGQSSTNSGSNTKWIFDFPPNAVDALNATAQTDGDIWLTWTAAGDPDDNPLGAGSQYVIEWSTYTAVVWSTSTVGDTGTTFTSHFFISTSAVSTGDSQIFISTGLTANVTYYFQIWTKDPLGTWSLGLSNQDNAWPVEILGMSLSIHSYDFTTVNLTATTISTTPVVLTNLGNVTQTYALAVATTGPSGIWGVKVATPTVMDQFVIFAGFNATAPSSTAFVNIDGLTNTSAASTATKFAIGQTGLSTPQLSTRDLWFRLDMPPSTTTTVQQQMTMTITASTP